MMSRSSILAIAALLCLNLGSASGQSPASLSPSGWDSDIRLAEPADLNLDPRVLEIDLTAKVASVEVAPGKRNANAWTLTVGCPVR